MSTNSSRKLLSSVFGLRFLALALALAVALPALAQDDQTQSVADAARIARANHAQQTTATSAPEQHPPFSQTQLIAWQIAGVSTPNLLNTVKANGIAFSPDDAHLNPLEIAQLPADLLAALPGVPAHPDASAAGIPQSLIAASQAYNSKDYSAARQALEPLAQQNPNADLYAALGNLLILCHDLPAAKSAFERAVQLEPAFLYAHVRLAGIYYGLQNPDQTSAEAKKILKLQPDNAEGRRYLSLSLSLKLQGTNGTSASNGVEDLSDLSNGDGISQEAKDLNNQAIQLEDQGDYKGAEAAWNSAIKLDPKVALFYYSIANMYVKWGGHNVLASNAFRQAKALAPRNLAIRQNYGHFLCEGHAFNDAITEFREILKMDPDWNIARPCLYTSLYAVGQKNEAAHVLVEYRHWNQTHGVPDDSDQIEAHEPTIDGSGRPNL
jgi:Tfp pilus assembly protein PilF